MDQKQLNESLAVFGAQFGKESATVTLTAEIDGQTVQGVASNKLEAAAALIRNVATTYATLPVNTQRRLAEQFRPLIANQTYPNGMPHGAARARR